MTVLQQYHNNSSDIAFDYAVNINFLSFIFLNSFDIAAIGVDL